IFSNDNTSHLFGGYGTAIEPPFPFHNHVPSPLTDVGDARVYLVVAEYDHPFARCGYDDQLHHVSDVSIDGECRNRPGTRCVLASSGWWVCDDDTRSSAYAEHDYFASCTIVHEIAHSFGFGGTGEADHYGTPICRERTGMSAADAANEALFQSN